MQTTSREPWHGGREEVFAAMRRLGEHVDRWYADHRRLIPPAGTVGIGGADFDYLLKANCGFAYLRVLRNGGSPADALKAAENDGAECLQIWNERTCRQRAFVSSREELKRWGGAAQAAAENVHRLFTAMLPEGVK